jgi:DNA polymerase I-like protein with 3'-5' exonuclease and polymerase domains
VGFYSLPAKNVNKNETKGLSLELLHKLGCRACPLDRVKGNKNPHLAPQGSDEPLIYMLDGPPTTKDDGAGKNFAGGVDRIIKRIMPGSLRDKTRWSSITRTASREIDKKVEKKVVEVRQYRKGDKDNPNEYIPPRAPTPIEIACCRPSVEDDIARTKPDAIFAFGTEALFWLTGQRGIEKWRGRRFPVTVKDHTCWVYPLQHPYHARSKRRWDDRESEEEKVFEWDVVSACHDVLDGLPDAKVHDIAHIADDVEIIDGTEPGDLEKALDHIASCYEYREVGFDYETDRLRPYNRDARIISVALSHKDATVAIALDHPKAGWSDEDVDDLFDALKEFLLKATLTTKIVHQLAFEMEWSGVILGRDTIRAAPWFDTVSEAYVLDERMKMGKPDALSLEFLCLQYFGFNLKLVSNLDRKNLIAAPIREMLRYNGLDAKYHRLLHTRQIKRIEAEGLMDVFLHHNERVPTAVLTQMKGVPVSQKVNTKFFKRFKKEEEQAYDALMDMPAVLKFERLRKIEFEPTNNGHVAWLMKNILKAKLTLDDADTTKESTDKKVLAQTQHPFARALEKYRSAAKNLVTYVMPARRGSPHVYDDGMMHPILSTNQTRTSRTSSENPNVQNWPKRKLKEVRTQIRGDETEVVVSFDYGQIQARNIAMESLDKAFVASFWDRHDIHADWTNNIAVKCPIWHHAKGLKDKELFGKARDDVKNQFVFPSFFGASYRSISRSLGLGDKRNQSRVRDLQDELFEMFPGIKKWQDGLKAFYLENGYVTGLSGYRRRGPISPNELINAPIQADEAMIVLDSMSRLSRKGWGFQANMEIHDDLTFIWKKKDVERKAEVVIHEMLNVPFKWAHVVPLAVEMAVGDSWGNTKKLETYFTDKWKGHDPHLGAWADGAGWEGMEKYSANDRQAA